MTRGFFAIGIEHSKTGANIGTLWRSAYLYGAAFIFTVGRRYSYHRDIGCADTVKAYRSIPLMHFPNIDALVESLPHDCPLVGIELDARAAMICNYRHMPRACYLLGAEDHGLTGEAVGRCHQLIKLPGRFSMNVASAGTVVMHDRWHKQQTPQAAEAAE